MGAPSGTGAGGSFQLGRATTWCLRSLRRYPLSVLVVAAIVTGAVVTSMNDGRGHASATVVDALVGLGAAGLLGLLGVPETVRRERLRRSGIRQADAMSGVEFEERLAVLFGALGYEVRRLGGTGDFGADLLVESDAVLCAVQAKRYSSSVGIEAVQQVIGARRYYGADEAMVVTNSSFTAAAATLAAADGVRLVERRELIRLFSAQPRRDQPAGGFRLLIRQWVAGARLLLFCVGLVLRGAWWVVRETASVVLSAWR